MSGLKLTKKCFTLKTQILNSRCQQGSALFTYSREESIPPTSGHFWHSLTCHFIIVVSTSILRSVSNLLCLSCTMSDYYHYSLPTQSKASSSFLELLNKYIYDTPLFSKQVTSTVPAYRHEYFLDHSLTSKLFMPIHLQSMFSLHPPSTSSSFNRLQYQT